MRYNPSTIGSPKPPARDVIELADGRIQWVYPSPSEIEAARAELQERVRRHLREREEPPG